MISYTDDSPPSPTLSTTSCKSSIWQQKSTSELLPILKDTYKSLKDKERELRMAAQFGKTLLEKNLVLKSNYDQLLESSPFPTPTQSSSLVNLRDEDDEENREMKYVTNKSTKEALVELLERENLELSNQLEEVMSNHEKLDRSHNIKKKQLEKQVKMLQQCLETASAKIQEMEESKKLSRKQLGPKETSSGTSGTFVSASADSTDSRISIEVERLNSYCDELHEKLRRVTAEHEQVLQSKIQIEKKLNETLHDLCALKQKHSMDLDEHEKLQKAFESQSIHIEELKISLEEHRIILSRLRSHGIDTSISEDMSQLSSRMSDCSISSLTDVEDFDFITMHKSNMKQTTSLLTELNNAWQKSQSSPIHDSPIFEISPVSSQNSYQTFETKRPLGVDSALESIIDHAETVEADALDDVLNLIGRLAHEYDHERFLQEKRHLCYNDQDTYQPSEEDNLDQNITYPEIPASTTSITLKSTHKPRFMLRNIIAEPTNVFMSLILLAIKWIQFSFILIMGSYHVIKTGPGIFFTSQNSNIQKIKNKKDK